MGVIRYMGKSKLSPRCIGAFEILYAVGEVAYELPLPLDGKFQIVNASKMSNLVSLHSSFAYIVVQINLKALLETWKLFQVF